jgi:hypothetical protein
VSAGLSVLSADSIKAALDIDWDDEEAQAGALEKLLSRHGRKSKTKLFNGYKRHIAIANNLKRP